MLQSPFKGRPLRTAAAPATDDDDNETEDAAEVLVAVEARDGDAEVLPKREAAVDTASEVAVCRAKGVCTAADAAPAAAAAAAADDEATVPGTAELLANCRSQVAGGPHNDD